ncbi:MAG: hypothetical protein KGI00_04420 [Candidatus Micrarchaeota archaeon]|nr:hypothetical protein [Candidatus Micrarchaeota archaeon]MDE1824053.1 hypothetical protein [Candidatus Micrarchaeota archaeon]MDE1849944.1 hypothetical protein [Candidatus Micrarchaeota archaeon]
MDRRRVVISIVLLSLLLSATMVAAKTTGSSVISKESAFDSWLPIAIIAILVALGIAGTQYMAGVLLGNQGVKTRALSEFGQVFGSAVLVVIILIVLNFFGTALTAMNLVSPSRITPMCDTLSGSQIDVLNSAMKPPSSLWTSPSPTAVICNDLIYNKGNIGATTRNIDYGLGAAYVINANMTNQTLRDFSELYSWDNLLLFLRQFKIYQAFCAPLSCISPLNAGTELEIKVTSDYFAGYVLHRGITPIMAAENILTFYIFFVQMLFILIMLLLWPYLLAAGLILRTVAFTRRVGGFLIALTVVALLIYPFLALFQYHTLDKMQNLQPIGVSSMPNLALCGRATQTVVPICVAGSSSCQKPVDINDNGKSNALNGVYCYTTADKLSNDYVFKGLEPDGVKPSGTMVACPKGTTPNNQQTAMNCYVKKNVNLFVLPDVKDVVHMYAYWPPGGNIIDAEIQMYLFALAPFNAGPLSLSSLLSLGSSGFKSLNAFPECFSVYGATTGICIGPKHMGASITALFNLYALIALPGFVLPIINVLMLLSAVLGISSLMGGETTLLGLTRMV